MRAAQFLGACSLGLVGLVAALALTQGGFALAQGGGVPLAPASPNRLPSGPEAEFVSSRCVVCHSADLITQQRLKREVWVREVNKMITWGARATPEERDRIVEYLASTYSPDVPVPALGPAQIAAQDPAPVSAGPAARAGDPVGGARLFATNCAACHGARAQGDFGPRLPGRAILDDSSAFRAFVKVGRNAMPPFADVLEDGPLEDIRAFLVSLPKP